LSIDREDAVPTRRLAVLARRATVAASVLLLGPGLARDARAHGSAPAALGVLTELEPGVPALVALSQGAGERAEAGPFGFVCPSVWGGEAAVLAASGDQWAAVSAGHLFLRAGGTCDRAEIALGAGVSAADVVADPRGGRFLVLGRDEATVRAYEVKSLDGQVRLLDRRTPPCRLDGVALGAGSEVAWGACGGPTPLLWPLDERSLARGVLLPFYADRLEPKLATEEAVWLRASTSKGAFVVEQRLLADPSDEPPPPLAVGPFGVLFGPVLLDATTPASLAFVGDGRLWLRTANAWEQREEVSFTCLSRVGETLYACEQGRVVRLEHSGGALLEKETVFSLSMLGAPSASCVPAVGSALCGSDWSHFGAEAGLLDTSPASTPDAPRGPPPGAGAAPSEAAAPAASPGLGCALAPDSRQALGADFRRPETSGGLAALSLLFAARRRGRARR
jgi:hypothetical protein